MKRGTLRPGGVRESLDDRGKIGSGIGEHVVDAALGEPRDVSVRRHDVLGLAVVHGLLALHWSGVMQGDGPPKPCQ